MKFDLKTPCVQCPFRTDIQPFLRPERAREITRAVLKAGQTFACHKTVRHDDEGDSVPSASEQHCAGALIMIERLGVPNQMMRIAERLGVYDYRKLDMDAPVFASAAAMVKRMRR
jgi:hypothetical protein